ncbi:hypothetical protein WA158_006064 [Blastocystis sp. Blastoise]
MIVGNISLLTLSPSVILLSGTFMGLSSVALVITGIYMIYNIYIYVKGYKDIYKDVDELYIDPILYSFIDNEILSQTPCCKILKPLYALQSKGKPATIRRKRKAEEAMNKKYKKVPHVKRAIPLEDQVKMTRFD